MSKIFITGSSDGIGKLAAQLLISHGHEVVVHARNKVRGEQTLKAIPGCHSLVIGDLSLTSEMRSVADQVNALGKFDAIIHNAAVGYQERNRVVTMDNLAHVFAVNSLSPYVLTCLIEKPKRLIYVSSSLHQSGDASLHDLNWETRPWSGYAAYSDSKFHNVILAFAVARKWGNVYSNAIDPGWVPTKMGGPSAPDDLQRGCETQVWLATSNDADALVSGKYFYHGRVKDHHQEADDASTQDRFLLRCEQISGVGFPG